MPDTEDLGYSCPHLDPETCGSSPSPHREYLVEIEMWMPMISSPSLTKHEKTPKIKLINQKREDLGMRGP